jgi:integrase
MLTLRLPTLCSELMRSPLELLEFATIPIRFRPRRLRTHSARYADALVRCVAAFISWALANEQEPLPASPDAVLAFLRDLRENFGMGIPEVLYHRTALNNYHHTHDFPSPGSRDLAMYAAALRREHTRVKATPLDTERILRMCATAALEGPMRAARDIAILLLDFAGAFRPSELSGVCFEDLDFRSRGLRVMLPSSKNHYRKPTEVTITPGGTPASCPIAALKRWLSVSGISSGPVFRRVTRYDTLGKRSAALCSSTISEIVKRHARGLGIPGKLSSYSLRRGCATTAIDNGASLHLLSDHMRHEFEETTQEYVDRRPVPFDQSISALVLP